MKIAFVFPGQGSQHVGMGKSFYDNFPEVKALYNEAGDVLGYDIAALSFNGPAEELNKTIRTQPAILLASAAAFTALTSKGVIPSVVAGHSLGEYTALVAAKAISLRDALKLTETRGRIMQEAVPEGKGLMAAILGLDREKVDGVCASVVAGYVRAANYNCPGQVVISGEKEAVEEAMRRAKDAGAKRAIPLAVSVPSHSALMDEAASKLSEYLFLEDIKMSEPKVPVVSNADGIFVRTVDGIKASLVKQLNNPVLWEDSVAAMVKFGARTFIEVGPGAVLAGLIKRIDPGTTIYNVQDTGSLNDTIEGLRAGAA